MAKAVALVLMLSLSAPAAWAEACRIAVAANFTAPIKQLLPLFSQLHQRKHQPSVITGSTGQLYAQIRSGAPYHAFLAADRERPVALVEENLALSQSLFSYALGRLVLWRPGAGQIKPEDLLGQANQDKIAAANPTTAPYGAATVEALKSLGLLTALRMRLVFGEDVSQAWQFAASSNAVAGFVSLAQVLALEPARRGVWWEVPASAYQPVDQQAVLLTSGKGNTCASDFLAFLRSPPARERIREMGYGLHDEP